MQSGSRAPSPEPRASSGPSPTDIERLKGAEQRRRMVANLRVTLWLILFSLIAYALTEVSIKQGDLPWLLTLRLIQFGVLGVALFFLSLPSAERHAVGIAFLAQAGICVTVAATGILLGDATMPTVLFMIYTIGAASVLPWGTGGQIASILISGGTLLWNVLEVGGSVFAFGYAPVLAVAVGFGVSLYIAYDMERHRYSLARHKLERQHAQKEVRDSEEHFRSLIEDASDVIAVLDPDGHIEYLSPSAERRLGYSPERMVGQAVVDFIHPDDRDRVRDALSHLVQRDAGRPTELRFHHADGAWRTLEVVARRHEQNGRPAVIVNARDITERKEIERLKDELVSTVSHELRTPLTSLRGFVELLLHREFPPDKQREFLEIIHDESARLTRLINDFLDLQRIESGRQRYHFAPLDVTDLLQRTATVFAHDEAHPLSLDVANDLPTVYADADRIQQVLSNLISNAIKFSPDGGEVIVGAQRDADRVVFRVTDHGMGMEPEVVAQLFTRFFRADNRETRRVGGTGLGLALVKQIVEAHRGNVWVESEPGRGSTFSFTLPVSDAAAS